jgi:hypothetical protein
VTPEHVPEGLLLGSYGASDPPGWCARWYGAQGAVGEERAVSALLRAASGEANLYARRPYVAVGHRRPSGAKGQYRVPMLGSMQDRASDLRRIPLPRTWVNKAVRGMVQYDARLA